MRGVNWRTILSAVVIFSLPIGAQTVQAVVNVGDWTPRLTLGTIGAVFGTNLAQRECVAQMLPLPNDLCGVEVLIIDSAGNYLAPLFYVSPTQVNFYFPVTQIYNGKDAVRKGQSTTINVAVCVGTETSYFTEADFGGACKVTPLNALMEPAILEWSDSAGVLHPVLTHADGRVVTSDAPAEWGETLVLYGVGFGVFNDASGTLAAGFPADGYPAPADRLVPLFTEFTDIKQVTSEVGGLPIGEIYVYPRFVGLSPGFVGLTQINFEVPCLGSRSREPRVYVEALNQTRTKAFTIPMSDAAKAAWGGRECR